MGDDAAAIRLMLLRQGGRGSQGGDGRCWVTGTTSSGSSSSLFSSTSSLTDDDQADDATSPRYPPGPLSSSTSSSSSSCLTSSDKMHMDGAAAVGPLYELSTMLDHLPCLRRTGLSEYYRGRSQSFTSLADVSSAADLAKKTAPYTRRRTYAAALGAKNQMSKKIAKKVQKNSPRNAGLLCSSNRPPAYHGKI